MKHIQLTQNQVALVDDSDYAELSKHKWCASKNPNGDFYATRNVKINGKLHTIFMHREILGLEYGDPRHSNHKNHQTLDNRRDNIRICTRNQNQMNQKPRQNTTSKYKGVSWVKQREEWQAQVRVNGKSIHLGYYDDEEMAAMAYDLVARKAHGEFAYLNFLPPQSIEKRK